MSSSSSYDILIVGAGAAGATLAHALSRASASRPAGHYRIALLERSLAEPDRIVGELLQPGGWEILKRLDMGDCVDDIDAIPVHGYSVVKDGQAVRIPYTDAYQGRSFHHGRFIQNLRKKALAAPGVETIEATVTDLLESPLSGRVIGVKATRKSSPDGTKESFHADLVVVADGCFSNFRSSVYRAKPKTASVGHFVGVILKDATLPNPKHGTVCLIRGHGPVLLYQIAEHDTRMLVDVKAPLPADLKTHILDEIVPRLPSDLQLPAKRALDADRLRRMPNTFLAPEVQGGRATKEGVILLGDAWNMRHPLTGGGMTVAFHDVELLSQLLLEVLDLTDWDAVSAILRRWHWMRKPLAATVNILSVALYDLFSADDEYLTVLRDGCFAYFERGGTCVSEPVGILSAVRQDTWLLFYHFVSVAFYSIYVMFTRPRIISGASKLSVQRVAAPSVDEYPLLCVKAVRVLWTASVVFGPLLWSEYRWW